MIEVDNLSFTYANDTAPAISNISLEIGESEIVLVTGPSGSGKSTLCRCFNGLIPHFYGGTISGRLRVCELDPHRTSTRVMAEKVGMVFQDPENQLVTTDVEHEIAFGLENIGLSKQIIAKRIEETLDTVGIDHLRRKNIESLSGGEKQKVAIASVLALHPDILVLDEPTSELDPKGAEEVLQLVQRLNSDLGITVILIEHRIDRVVPFMDRVLYMDQGRIIFDGSPRDWVEFVSTKKEYGLPQFLEMGETLLAKGYIDTIPLSVKEGRQKLEPIFSHHWKGCSETQIGRECHEGQASPVVQFSKVWFRYEDGTVALRDVNLSIPQGQFVAVIGRNASGKSTLAQHINGILKPTKGKVFIDKVDTNQVSAAKLSRKVGYVFQNPNLHLFADTVEEEVAFILHNQGVKPSDIEKKVGDVLATFDLIDIKDKYPRSLSGGEKQRVALASVLVGSPKILVLDEPTRGLEHRRKQMLLDHLEQFHKRGGTVLLITHDIELVSRPHIERVILMSEGKIVADGTRKEILSKSLHFSPQINRLIQPFKRYGVPDDMLTMEEIMCGLE